MSDNQTNPAKLPHKYAPGDRVRILKPARGIPETARFIGTLGTLGTVVRVADRGDLFVEPDAAPDRANSWWYGSDEVEFVEYAPPAPTPPGWYVVLEWCDDANSYVLARLVWSTSEFEACLSAGRAFDGREPKACRIELPAKPTIGTVVPL